MSKWDIQRKEFFYLVTNTGHPNPNPYKLRWNNLLQADHCFPGVHQVHQVKGSRMKESFTKWMFTCCFALSPILQLAFYYEDVTKYNYEMLITLALQLQTNWVF